MSVWLKPMGILDDFMIPIYLEYLSIWVSLKYSFDVNGQWRLARTKVFSKTIFFILGRHDQ